MKILCDFHHSDQWWSHSLILEQELGFSLYRPFGMAWHEQKYCYPDHPPIAKQFLSSSLYPDRQGKLRLGGDARNGCPYYPDFKPLSLDEFVRLDIDVIMCTNLVNMNGLLKLRDDKKPNAKMVQNVSNVNWAHQAGIGYPNLITTDPTCYHKASCSNKILYHQRFDTLNVFRYKIPGQKKIISCFQPGLRNEKKLYDIFRVHAEQLPEFEFRDYGWFSTWGFLNTKTSLAQAMSDSLFVWQVKPVGDGFGHILHNALALGRPIITNKKHYEDNISGHLLRDGETCIDIRDDVDANCQKIMDCAKNIQSMSLQAYEAFLSIDFASELEQIRSFFSHLT